MTSQDIQVQLIDFPVRGNEVITKNEDDTYTIFINARLSYEKQKEAYKHALRHIKNDDFRRECSADEIEFAAHEIKNF